ncbi:MAG TPA: crotonase/enoyl-CoA hydratase family protein [Acidimicrobiales bacterium]|nr:crotonase/enoyl-CoA hydratase family protein [Acidimicrobiales bacterium]
MSDRVTITIDDDGVADVRLNRADKMNALDQAMFRGLVDASTSLKHESGLRAVVLSGEGRGFCAGLDFGSFQQMAGAEESASEATAADVNDGGTDDVASIGETGDRITHFAQQSAYGWMELAVPVVAALHGPVLGGGLQIALGADIRIVAPDTKMSVLEVRWGLIPDMTGTATLHRLVGNDVAKELTFTGRMVEADEAVRIGLATRVADDPRAEAMALAHEIAGKSPDAIRGAKRLLDLAGRVGLAEQFAAERATIGKLIGSPNQTEAVMSYFEKRPPKFTDPT